MPQPKNRRRAAPQDLDYVSPLCLCGDEQGSKWATAKPIAVVNNLAQLQRFYASLKPAARASVLKTPALPELLPQVVDACELGIEHASALAAKYLTNSTMVDGARQYFEQVLNGDWPLLPGSPPGLRMSDDLVTLAANQLGGGLLKRFGGCTPVSTIVVPNKLGLIRFPSEAESLPESTAAMKEASDQGVCRPLFGVHYRPWSDEDEVYVYRGLLDCCRLISGIIVVLQRRLHRAMMRAELVKQLTKSGPTAAGALTIADSCQTWSWGVGAQGQLGLGAIRHADTPTPIPALADQRVIQVAASGSHALALSTYGVLFGWGSGQQGATGLHDTEPSRVPLPCSAVSYTPQLIPRPVQMVAAGELHTLALQDERCYGWGAAWLGQLGNTTMLLEGGCLLPYDENDYMPITTLVPGMSFSPEYLEAINPAAAAAARAAAAQRRANGQGVDDGQMEHEGRHPACLVMLSGAPVAFGPRINPDKRGCRPGKILTDIVAIAAGGMHSLCATRDGACWIWGCNEALSLGVKVTEEEMQQPWVQAMGCGCCDGKDMVIISVSAPVEVDLDGVASGKVVGVAAGASISVILTDEGEVVTWGASRRDPWRVDRQFKERGAAVAAGGMYAMAVTRDTGSVWIWARNHINEWSSDRDAGAPRPKHQAWLPRKVPFLSNVERADCSSTHCIASTRDGCVYWWPHSAMAPGQPAPAAGSYEVVTLRGLSVLSVAVGDNFALCSTGSPPTEDEEEGGMAQGSEAVGPPVQGNGASHKEQEPAPPTILAPVNQQL